MKKEEEDKEVLNGSRTIMNGSTSSIYNGLRRKVNEIKKKKRMIVEVYIHVMQMAAGLIFLGNPCKASIYKGLA